MPLYRGSTEMVSLHYEFVCVELKEKRIEILFDTSHIAAHFLLYPYFFDCPPNDYSKLGYGIKIENLYECLKMYLN